MSDQRLIDANALYRDLNELATLRSGSPVTKGLIQAMHIVRDAPTVDAVPRDEHEYLLKRFRHLLKSDYIRSFDEVDPNTGEYKRDIKKAVDPTQRIIGRDLGAVLYVQREDEDRQLLGFAKSIEYKPGESAEAVNRHGVVYGSIYITPAEITVCME